MGRILRMWGVCIGSGDIPENHQSYDSQLFAQFRFGAKGEHSFPVEASFIGDTASVRELGEINFVG